MYFVRTPKCTRTRGVFFRTRAVFSRTETRTIYVFLLVFKVACFGPETSDFMSFLMKLKVSKLECS